MSVVKHIGFDARYVRIDHHDGISRFSARVGSALWNRVSKTTGWKMTFLISDERQREHLPSDAPVVLASSPTSLSEPFFARSINNLNFDVVYSPMQTMGSRGRKFRLVLTVHDLIYYSHPMPPRQFHPLLRLVWRLYHLWWFPQRMLLNGADSVVAVSHTTASLIGAHKLTKRPTHVVYNASDLSSVSSSHQAFPFHSREKTLVYMGSFLPYKNVETLIDMANQLPDYRLHLLSRIDPRDKSRLEKKVEHSNVVFHNGVSDDEYVEILSVSHALLTASLDEGFGIPVIEAMVLGTPVICSDIPIFREIGATAALYINPHQSHTLVDAVRSLEDEVLWKRHSALGLEQSQKFNWDQSAEELFDVLKDCADF